MDAHRAASRTDDYFVEEDCEARQYLVIVIAAIVCFNGCGIFAKEPDETKQMRGNHITEQASERASSPLAIHKGRLCEPDVGVLVNCTDTRRIQSVWYSCLGPSQKCTEKQRGNIDMYRNATMWARKPVPSICMHVEPTPRPASGFRQGLKGLASYR